MIAVLAWIGVAVLGAIGSLARFRVGAVVTSRWPSDYPFGTFVVNLSGGFILGVLTAFSLDSDLMLAVGTGLLGGYTTFSTWMVEAQRLGEDGAWTLVWLYIFGSMIAGLAAAGGGWVLGSLFT